jgi:hypothetical protein
MDAAGLPALIEAIKHMHDADAAHVETVHVTERSPNGETVWEGDVEVFDLAGFLKARRAYAWSEPTTGTKRRFFAVLEAGPVTDAATAVRASILADARGANRAKG